MTTSNTAGIRCGLCGTTYPCLPGITHQCGPKGHASFDPDSIDYERIRRIVREEIIRSRAPTQASEQTP